MSDVENSQQEERMPLPPPSFAFIVVSLRAQVEMHLGLVRLEEQEQSEPDLVLARHAIDMLAVLQEKTKGNLTLEEQRLLENSLTELRFRFVQVSEESAKTSSQQA
jgi:hypothetical protein